MHLLHLGQKSAIAIASIGLALAIGGCANVGQPATGMACNDKIKSAYRADDNTTVLLVKLFESGEAIALANSPRTPAPPIATSDLCLVKLVVGPGNPGPAGAPSTSAGIGIEVWLPSAANWNQRIRAYGNGGWAGSAEADPANIASGGDGTAVHVAAAGKGYAVVTSDHGHAAVPGQAGAISSSFAMLPDGSINTRLWNDFSERSLHEMADKTKSLVKLYYGKSQRFSYWDGYSSGGRQGLKLAQIFPNDFDGILVGAPAINWTQFITNELYPQIAMIRDLGKPIPGSKIAAATTAAIHACGGAALGFLTDPYSCRYDPSKDASALCVGAAGSGGVIGKNSDAASCLKPAEAALINKIWYGQTSSGTAPDPALDNASGPNLSGSDQLWFGLTRGTDLSGLAGASEFPIASDQVGLEMQNPALASAFFMNTKGNGANQWKNLGYSDLTLAAFQGLALQPEFSNINTDNPDLSAFKARHGKMILYHGLVDNLIAPQGSDNYYHRVMSRMGGLSVVQTFFRHYHIPGLSHAGLFQGPSNFPAPQSALGRDEMFQALQTWVEQGTAPASIKVTSPDGTVSMPLCVYPQKVKHSGSNLVTTTDSYSCQ